MVFTVVDTAALVACLVLVMMAGNALGRRFGFAAVDAGGRVMLRRMRRAVADAKLAFEPSRVHVSGSCGIAIDDRGGVLVVASGRRTRLLNPAAILGCRSDRRSLAGWTWHYLFILTSEGELAISFHDLSARDDWARRVSVFRSSAA